MRIRRNGVVWVSNEQEEQLRLWTGDVVLPEYRIEGVAISWVEDVDDDE